MRVLALSALAFAIASCSPPPTATPAAETSTAAPVAESVAASVAPIEAAAASTAPATVTPGKAAPWKVDAAHSSIHFSVNHKVYGAIGADFQGWTAKIMFDPGDLAHSSVSATIPMAGVKLGLPDANAQWPTAEWADPAHFPTAKFESASFKSLGGDKYQASGTVTIKGKSAPATLPFTLTIANNVATMSGSLALDRTKFDIGMQSDAAGDWVDKTIHVAVKVRATTG